MLFKYALKLSVERGKTHRYELDGKKKSLFKYFVFVFCKDPCHKVNCGMSLDLPFYNPHKPWPVLKIL